MRFPVFYFKYCTVCWINNMEYSAVVFRNMQYKQCRSLCSTLYSDKPGVQYTLELALLQHERHATVDLLRFLSNKLHMHNTRDYYTARKRYIYEFILPWYWRYVATLHTKAPLLYEQFPCKYRTQSDDHNVYDALADCLPTRRRMIRPGGICRWYYATHQRHASTLVVTTVAAYVACHAGTCVDACCAGCYDAGRYRRNTCFRNIRQSVTVIAWGEDSYDCC